LYRSEFSDVTYLEDLNVVFVKWKKFCRQDDYRKPLLFAIHYCYSLDEVKSILESEYRSV